MRFRTLECIAVLFSHYRRRQIHWLLLALIFCVAGNLHAQTECRVVSGTVESDHSERIPGVIVSVRVQGVERSTRTDSVGAFKLCVPRGEANVNIKGRYIASFEQKLAAGAPSTGLKFQVRYQIPTAQETLVISAKSADPAIDRRNGVIYQETLFSRDDQLLETLDSGLNAGQHEGGGKSLEFRRFGFNLDHGGANGGLKVLVDDVPQNQATQAHGQGYLGWLKALSPELVDGVDIINGPFNAEYGDFSALGVIHIRQKERLDDRWTLRAQGGSFGSYRTFAAWSPKLEGIDSFVSWEHAYTEGPFKSPLKYVRDNFTANYTMKLDGRKSLGLRLSGGRNDFDSSGQLPLDQVLLGNLDRFGFIDKSDGGRVRNGTAAAYYKLNMSPSDTLRADGFVTRSLFDLYSNFTFFLNDPVHGDGIQQHDSRLQEGSSLQYVHGGKLFGKPAVLVAGANLFDYWINVDLLHQQDRKVIAPAAGDPWTENNVHITNEAFFLQQGVEFRRVHVDAGLRYDGYRFNVTDRLGGGAASLSYSGYLEPKVNIVYTPSEHVPASLHFDYGRAVTSQDARGIAVQPDAPKATATDFYMMGTSHNLRRFSASTDVFLINRQHEDVYDADNGTMNFQGPSRSYGWEVKTSVQLTSHVSWNAGVTQVSNAFFLGTRPRQYVDSAPHAVANSSVTLSGWHDTFCTVRYRHIGHYLLVNPDGASALPAFPYTDSATARASGLDVVDFALTKKIRRGLDWSLTVDNVNNKSYYETQNLFNSRLIPTDPVQARIHGTPGYPVGFSTGLTLRLE